MPKGPTGGAGGRSGRGGGRADGSLAEFKSMAEARQWAKAEYASWWAHTEPEAKELLTASGVRERDDISDRLRLFGELDASHHYRMALLDHALQMARTPQPLVAYIVLPAFVLPHDPQSKVGVQFTDPGYGRGSLFKTQVSAEPHEVVARVRVPAGKHIAFTGGMGARGNADLVVGRDARYRIDYVHTSRDSVVLDLTLL